MRLALLSYSHHGRSMARVARELGHEIVGVMDAEESPRNQLAADFQCAGYAHARASPLTNGPHSLGQAAPI